MVRVLILIAAIFSAFAVHAASVSEAPDRYRLRSGIELSYIDSCGYTSWTEGLVGELRYDDSNEGLMISRAFADYEFQLADTLKAHAAAEAYDDNYRVNSRLYAGLCRTTAGSPVRKSLSPETRCLLHSHIARECNGRVSRFCNRKARGLLILRQ